MPQVPLSIFLDYTASTGTTRLSKLRQAKRAFGQEYSPATDFYGPLRRRIVQAFEEGWEPTAFDAALAEVDDPKKQDNYAACRKGLRKWAGVSGKRKYEWAGARRAVWRSGPLEVNVSPELWVRIDGDLHIIKLYCKRDKLSQHKVNVALHLLEETVGHKGRVGILDVQQGKLFAQTTRPEGIDLLLASEAAGFAALWDSL